MDHMTQHSHQFGFKINVHKTKQMVISKNTIAGAHLCVNQTRIERVEQYCYLGTMINEKWDNTQEIKCCRDKARTTFNKMSAFFKSHKLSLKTKMRHTRCYVFSVLLHGVESWTLNYAITKKIKAFELWMYKRI
jgi:hypothetical protein